jgi:hypothetical protein
MFVSSLVGVQFSAYTRGSTINAREVSNLSQEMWDGFWRKGSGFEVGIQHVALGLSPDSLRLDETSKECTSTDKLASKKAL